MVNRQNNILWQKKITMCAGKYSLAIHNNSCQRIFIPPRVKKYCTNKNPPYFYEGKCNQKTTEQNYIYDHLRPRIPFTIMRYDFAYKRYILSSPVDVPILSLNLKVHIKRIIKKGVNKKTIRIVCRANFKMYFMTIKI